MRGRGPEAAAVVLAAVLALASTAGGAPAPPTAWDGANPFRCELQSAGFGTAVAQPDADPYCVDFDKRRQNVSELGVVDFLTKEPARVSAASPKCFYFQSDHWRGSIVQSDGSTKTYEWDGHYYFDKARGEGGAWVTNFNVNGRTGDPSQIPGMPADSARYFGPGTGGVTTHNDVPADPACIAKAAREHVYATPRPENQRPRCAAPTGEISIGRIGLVQLGQSGADVRRILGEPLRVHRGFLRYCLSGGAKLLVGQPGDRSGGSQAIDNAAPVVIVVTTHPAFAFAGVRRGDPARTLRSAFPRRHLRFIQGRTTVYELVPGVLAGLKRGHVRFLAVYATGAIPTDAALRLWLRRSR